MGIIAAWIMLLSSTCSNPIKASQPKNQYSYLDSIWLPFAKAMDTKDIAFLIRNSFDTVSCADCKIEPDLEKGKFDSKFIFQNHLEKVRHLQTVSNKDFSTYQVDSNMIRVVYRVKAPQAPEGAYGLIFTLIKKDGKYLFEGMIVQ